jgi:FlgD Ig-like domain
VDRTASFLRWSHAFYPQDGDALEATASITWQLSRAAVTTMRLYDDQGRLIRTVWKERSQRAGRRGWTWDGKLADGSYVSPGRYQARLTVTSSLGTVVLGRRVWVTPYIVSLSATSVRPGQTLTVRFSTVEPLANRPKVVLRQPGLSAVTTKAAKSNGRYVATFVIRGGGAGAAQVEIRARDAGGRVNRLSMALRVGS